MVKQVVLVPSDRVGVLTAEVRDEIKKRLGVNVSTDANSVELEGEGLELQKRRVVGKDVFRFLRDVVVLHDSPYVHGRGPVVSSQGEEDSLAFRQARFENHLFRDSPELFHPDPGIP